MSYGLILLVLLLAGSACRPRVVGTPILLPTAPPAQSASPTVLPTSPPVGTFQPANCPFVLPEGLRQDQEVECGYLVLAEQRSTQGTTLPGRLIRLAVAVFHPPGGATQADPVIFLSGGPGASALEMVRYQFETLSIPVFASGRDLILFDQRGVGLSQPALDCTSLDQLTLDLADWQVDDRQVSSPEIGDLILESLRECRAELADVADLSAYHTAANAADVNDLRLALGYSQVNLWGGSYGTRLALEVVRLFPEGLRSVVLDSVYPPDVNLHLEAPVNFSRALELFFASCAENQACEGDYPDLRQVFFALVEDLNATPASVEITHPLTGETFTAVLDGNGLMGLTFQSLYDHRLRFLLPEAIYAASQGDYDFFNRFRGLLLAQMSFSSRGMMLSVQCHDEFPFSSLEAFQAGLKDYPELAGMYSNALLGELIYRICPFWGAGQAGEEANMPVYGDIPVLIMSGEMDPITPPSWARRAAGTLENAWLFEYPGLAHGVSAASGCPQQMMTAFLKDPARPPSGDCIAGLAKP